MSRNILLLAGASILTEPLDISYCLTQYLKAKLKTWSCKLVKSILNHMWRDILNGKIMRFSAKFYELIAGAEVVVTHFGSTALEAVVYGKPMVMVLNPEWKRTVGEG